MDFLVPAAATRRHRSLRRALCAVLASLTCLSFVGISSADATSIPSRTANSFVESIGVNTHFYYSDTPYVENFETVKSRLAELGVSHIRENIAPSSNPGQVQRLKELAALGIKSDLILGVPTNGTAKLEEMLSTVKNQLSGTVEAVEGPNEFDAGGTANWEAMLREYQQRLYTSVKSNPALSSLTVVGPSVVTAADEESLGGISQMLDVGSMHTYATDFVPEKLVPECLQRAQLNAGTVKPSWATEAGYNTAMNYSGSLPPVSEAAQAAYMPRLLLENYRVGFARTYMYELLDEAPDPSGTDREAHWGLLRNDLTPKPAFTAVKNLISILKDPGPEFSSTPLALNVTGNTNELHQVLLQKRDGTYYVALWRSSSLWSTTSRTALAATTTGVTLNFGQSIQTAERFLPDSSTSPVESVPSPKSLNVEVGPEVVLVKLTPSGSAPVGSVTESPSTPTIESPKTTEPPSPKITEPPSGTTTTPTQTDGKPTTGSDSASGSGSTETTTHPTSTTTAPVADSTKPVKNTSGKSARHGAKVTVKTAKVTVKTRRRSARAGRPISIHGRLVAAAAAQVSVRVEQWEGSWQVVGSGRTSGSGQFETTVELPAGAAQLRVVAPQATPSVPIRVRVTA
jgi:hypothetical protein